jgi:cytoskeletal protein CcmA (bactofilin family)
MSFFGTRRQTESPTQPSPEKPVLPKPTLPTSPVGFETVLGANSSLEGVLRSSANVRLDGSFSGTLEINGNVLVGETAKINADINARNISIAGAVRGNVSGKKVQLLRTGRIWGDIRATALTTEEGAFIDGKITMVSHEATVSVTEAVPSEEPPKPENFTSDMTVEADIGSSSSETDEDAPIESADTSQENNTVLPSQETPSN